MNCDAARRLIGADPTTSEAELDRHVATCPDCAGYRREMRELEARIGRALALPPPVAGSAAPAARDNVVKLPTRPASGGATVTAARRGRNAWALAASVCAVAVAIGLLLVTGRGGSALAGEVVAHLAEEPDSWTQQRPVPQSALDLVLRRAGVRLDQVALGEVVYASACWFRGRYVPHLVVRTARGPVTVLVLTGETAGGVEHFSEAGYSGVLAPAPNGAVAVLGRGVMDVDEPLQRVQRALAPPAR